MTRTVRLASGAICAWFAVLALNQAAAGEEAEKAGWKKAGAASASGSASGVNCGTLTPAQVAKQERDWAKREESLKKLIDVDVTMPEPADARHGSSQRNYATPDGILWIYLNGGPGEFSFSTVKFGTEAFERMIRLQEEKYRGKRNLKMCLEPFSELQAEPDWDGFSQLHLQGEYRKGYEVLVGKEGLERAEKALREKNSGALLFDLESPADHRSISRLMQSAYPLSAAQLQTLRDLQATYRKAVLKLLEAYRATQAAGGKDKSVQELFAAFDAVESARDKALRAAQRDVVLGREAPGGPIRKTDSILTKEQAQALRRIDLEKGGISATYGKDGFQARISGTPSRFRATISLSPMKAGVAL